MTVDAASARVAAVRSVVGRARRGLSPAPFEGARDLPTMLASEEVDLLYLLARDSLGGAGDVVELGTFLGGSTVAIGRGLQDRDEGPGHVRVHTYDTFVQEAWPEFGVAADEDVLPRWERLVGPVRSLVDVHPGRVGGSEPIPLPGGPVDLLFVDLVKHAEAITPVMHDFLARTRPGSVVVHQDMFHWGSPWVLVTVEAMWDRCEFVGHVARASGVLVVTRPLAVSARAVDWGAIAPAAQLSMIDSLAERFTHPTLRGSIDAAAVYLARLHDPTTYRRRLARARAASPGPRVARYLDEIEATDDRGALAPPDHADPVPAS
ncbi:class I SAM-dependent methyltransferase [Cellulosimicrobium arenosum]|uniref:Class I SAM-dependent methyltransferase n=1 Tax=Cellulosimicrobium arenosum TaxID=2708133 RepID=A0A927G7B1_9MICO|nr:class I SAM-dependent methyltransferase [Cellulosimicrobium arenosum]MBD8078063.1 class I SAM-dependent methyltransferase [Cellulosimicrobium arenosum]